MDDRKKRRINVLRVPVDVLRESDIEECVKSLLVDGERHYIIFITLSDLLRARRSTSYWQILNGASLVLPVSKGILKGAKFLKKKIPSRYLPFSFIIRLMGILDKYSKSVYLLGTNNKDLQTSTDNIRTSFPKLKIVGRHSGYFSQSVGQNIVLAVRKASPSLLLAGKGIPGKSKWILKNRKHFSPGIYLWSGDCFDIFSGKKKRISSKAFDKGLEFLPSLIKKPWRIFRVFLYFWYLLLLLVYRIRGE